MRSVDSDSSGALAFLLNAPVFIGKSRRIGFASLFEWFEQAWAFFVVSPRFWLVFTASLLPFVVGLFFYPRIGILVFLLLIPFVSVGLLRCCAVISDDLSVTTPQLADFFVGFTRCPLALFLLGLCNVLFCLLIFVFSVLLWFGLFARAFATESSSLLIIKLLALMIIIPLFVLILCVPVLMATWFAPALVFFNRATPFAAIKASFNACRKNLLPLCVYGFLVLALLFFALLPVGLGLFLAIPVVVGSTYASYHDIFLAN